MTWQDIDYAFPFIVFFYGVCMTFVLTHPVLLRLAEERFSPELYSQFKAKKALGLVCLFVGFFWSLQNLWFY